jgi:hypothetical protein
MSSILSLVRLIRSWPLGVYCLFTSVVCSVEKTTDIPTRFSLLSIHLSLKERLKLHDFVWMGELRIIRIYERTARGRIL